MTLNIIKTTISNSILTTFILDMKTTKQDHLAQLC